MGRGVLIKGRWAERDEAPAHDPRPGRRISVPFDFPGFLLNGLTVRVFNELYYRKHWRKTHRKIMHPQSFFYPLDAIEHWNRLYGRRGFAQYQCVLPETAELSLHRRFFDVLVRFGGASFLSVIKDCGAVGKGILSFPMPGISIALDLAIRSDTQACVDALNEIVIEAGGRIYLSKDALTRPDHFRRMEPRLESFDAIRRHWDPEQRIVTAQSVRLLGDAR
jgi:FAD/FMN-containing dehydrogenase